MSDIKDPEDSKVTLVTVVKDREQYLERSLATWAQVGGVHEIVILDWGSARSLMPITFPYGAKVKLFRIEQALPWKLTLALNIASSLVRTDLMLKVDADTMLSHSFLESHPIDEASFYTGNWRIAEEENDHHLNGVFYCWTEVFKKVAGYHEGLETYGWDDSDLYDRLSNHLERRDFDLCHMYHQPHGDKIRMRHSDTKLNCADAIEQNRIIAEANPWSGPMSRPLELIEKSRYTEVRLDIG